MKKMFFILVLLSFFKGFSQTGSKEYLLYSKSRFDYDTTIYLKIEKRKKGYLFVFPADTSYIYQRRDSILKFDSIMQINQSIYGPYEFYKKKNRILFRNVERNKKYQLLYELNSKEFYAPNLFSSNADTYDYLTSLLDSNASLDVGDKRFPCFKYLQAFSDRPKLYRVIFIDKKTFLPIRINYYDDKDQKILTKEIFLLN